MVPNRDMALVALVIQDTLWNNCASPLPNLSHSIDIVSWGFGLVLRKRRKVLGVKGRARVGGRLTWVSGWWMRACLVMMEWLGGGRHHAWHQTSSGRRRWAQNLRMEEFVIKTQGKEERSPFRGDDVVLPKDSRVCNNSR